MHSIDLLTSGLRALEVLARHAPVAIDELARLAGTTSHQAHTLIETFVQHGYAKRFADTGCYVLTELAIPLVPLCRCDMPSASVH